MVLRMCGAMPCAIVRERDRINAPSPLAFLDGPEPSPLWTLGSVRRTAAIERALVCPASVAECATSVSKRFMPYAGHSVPMPQGISHREQGANCLQTPRAPLPGCNIGPLHHRKSSVAARLQGFDNPFSVDRLLSVHSVALQPVSDARHRYCTLVLAALDRLAVLEEQQRGQPVNLQE